MVKVFFGTYSRNLDPKGRLMLPRELGISSEEALYVMKGFEGCVSIFREEQFQEMLQKLSALNYADEASRTYVRLASASMKKLPIDSVGRVLLGKDLLKDYGIGKEVTLIGVLDHLELWDATVYARYLLQNANSYETLAGRSR